MFLSGQWSPLWLKSTNHTSWDIKKSLWSWQEICASARLHSWEKLLKNKCFNKSFFSPFKMTYNVKVPCIALLARKKIHYTWYISKVNFLSTSVLKVLVSNTCTRIPGGLFQLCCSLYSHGWKPGNRSFLSFVYKACFFWFCSLDQLMDYS